MTNIGIIGFGRMGKVHARIIDAHPRLHLSCCADLLLERRKEFESQYGAESYPDYHALLRRRDIDVVHACLPHAAYYKVVSDALHAKKHVLAEKPLALSVSELKDLMKKARKYGCSLGMVLQYRYHPLWLDLKKKLSRVGKITLIQASLACHRPDSYYLGWQGKKRIAGGGALLTQGIHILDLVLQLGGPVKTLKCLMNTRQGMKVEDCIAVSLQFQHGAMGSFIATTSASTDYRFHIEVHGTKGFCCFDNDSLTWNWKQVSFQRKESKHCPPASIDDYHARLITDYYSALKKKKLFPVSIQQALPVLDVIERCYASAKCPTAKYPFVKYATGTYPSGADPL